MKKCFASMLLAAASATAAGLGGPMPGYVVDGRSATIRAIYGIPGALQLGAPLDLPFAVSSAVFGPSGDYALAVSAGASPHAFTIRELTGIPAISDLGAMAEGTRILALNASGSAALLYAGDGKSVRFVNGLLTAPILSDAVSTAALSGPIASAALEDAGACAIVGTGALETLCADGSSRQILPAAGRAFTAIALIGKGRDIVLADGTAKRILLISGYANSSDTVTLASSADGIDAPAGLQVLSAGQIVVADSGASALFVLDAASGQPAARIDLDIAPALLQTLTDRSILLLNSPSAVPFTVMDMQSMRTFFVPSN